MLNLLYLCSINEITKLDWQQLCLQHSLLNILSPLLRPNAQKKSKFFLKYYCSLTMQLGYQNPWWRCDVQAVFIPVNITSILQPADQGIILTFKSYYLRNTFCKGIDARDCDSSGGSRQSKLKTLWKRFTILDANKSIHDSWEEVKTSNLTTVWEKLIPDYFQGFKTSAEEITTDVVKQQEK